MLNKVENLTVKASNRVHSIHIKKKCFVFFIYKLDSKKYGRFVEMINYNKCSVILSMSSDFSLVEVIY